MNTAYTSGNILLMAARICEQADVHDPFSDSEWIKTTGGKGDSNPEWEVRPQEKWNQRTLCESGTFIRIRQDCVQKVLPPLRQGQHDLIV